MRMAEKSGNSWFRTEERIRNKKVIVLGIMGSLLCRGQWEKKSFLGVKSRRIF